MSRRKTQNEGEIRTQVAHHVIRSHYDTLMKRLPGKDLVPQMFSQKLISDYEKQVIDAEPTNYKKNEHILSALERRSGKQFEVFLKSLKRLRVSDDLVTTLTDTYHQGIIKADGTIPGVGGSQPPSFPTSLDPPSVVSQQPSIPVSMSPAQSSQQPPVGTQAVQQPRIQTIQQPHNQPIQQPHIQPIQQPPYQSLPQRPYQSSQGHPPQPPIATQPSSLPGPQSLPTAPTTLTSIDLPESISVEGMSRRECLKIVHQLMSSEMFDLVDWGRLAPIFHAANMFTQAEFNKVRNARTSDERNIALRDSAHRIGPSWLKTLWEGLYSSRGIQQHVDVLQSIYSRIQGVQPYKDSLQEHYFDLRSHDSQSSQQVVFPKAGPQSGQSYVSSDKYHDHKAKVDVETDDQFQKKLITAAIEQGGSVEVEIVKCVTLGPPEAGKTQLKRALSGNMEESTESTPVSSGAEVIMERYFDGEVKWEPMGKAELQSALYETVEKKQYKANLKYPKYERHVASEVRDTTGEPSGIAPQEILVPTKEGKRDVYEKLNILKLDFDKLQKKVLANFTRTQGTRHLSKVRIIHFIDSGGQFFDLHPILCTSRAIYLIVYNSAEGLDVPPKITYRRPGDSPTRERRKIPNPKQKNKDLIKLSLFTLEHCKAKSLRMEDKAKKYLDIMGFTTEPSTRLPAVIIGSRINSREHQTDDSKIIEDHCCHIPMYRDNKRKVHFVDSMEPLRGIKELYDKLRKLECKFHIDHYPLKWFYCQLIFWSAEDVKLSVLTFSDLQAIVQEGGFVSGDEEFRALLTTFHMLGIFICPDLDLPEVDQESLHLSPVFTSPDVLLKQVTSLLEVPFLNPSEDFKNGPAIDKLQKSGIITRESLTLLGIPDTIGSFHGFHSYLLKYLLKWGLAAELTESSCLSGRDQLHKELFIPSILLPRVKYIFAPPPGFVALPSFALTVLKIKEEDYCIPRGLFPQFIVNIMNRHEEGYLIKVAKHKAEIRCRDVLAITKKANRGTELPYTIYVVDYIDHISIHITLARKGEDHTSCHSDCCTIVNDLKVSMEKAYSHLFGDEGTSSVIIGCKCTCDEAKSCHLAQLDCHNQVLRCLFPDREIDVEIPFSDTLKRIFQAHDGENQQMSAVIANNSTMSFNSKQFMEKYMDRFAGEVDSRAIATQLEMKKVIPLTLHHKIVQNESKVGALDLYRHIRDNASQDNVLTLCDVMVAVDGYARMNKLGRDMKGDTDLSLPDPLQPTPTDPLLTTPTINELQRYIIRHIALEWQSIGIQLDIEVSVLNIIEADVYPRSVEQCCRTMFTRWLAGNEGTGEEPRDWRTVLKALKNSGYMTLVGDVERILFE